MKKYFILSALLFGGTGFLFAQEKEIIEEKDPLTISGYAPHVVWRVEARNFNSKDRIFTKRNGSIVGDNASITTALAISF